MIICNISDELFEVEDKELTELLKTNFSNEMIDKLYFIPKKVEHNVIDKKINDKEYVNKIAKTIDYFKGKNIEQLIAEKFENYEKDTNTKLIGGKLFLIIGLDTTTIYSIKLDGEDVTVLLLEATNGDEDILDMLLAHEFTHFIRRQELKKDIFEESVGERFVTEGIASNYSREVVPGKKDSEYCIVDEKTVEWVKNNINKIEEHIIGRKNTSELMSDFFYMFADTNVTGMPVRTGYVYGYLKVKEYLENKNLKVKDIIEIDWKEIV